MSLVGSHVINTNKDAPNLLFKPGITGLSQQKNIEINPQQLRCFDEYYIQNYSFSFDLEIILKSLFKI